MAYSRASSLSTARVGTLLVSLPIITAQPTANVNQAERSFAVAAGLAALLITFRIGSYLWGNCRKKHLIEDEEIPLAFSYTYTGRAYGTNK
jgi:hypothetical protein